MLKLLLIFVAFSSSQCEASLNMFGSNFMDDINESINRITSSITKDIEDINKDIQIMNREIQEEVGNQLQKGRERTEEILQHAKTVASEGQGAHAGRTVHTFNKVNIEPGSYSNAQSFSSSSSAGSSKSSQSGVNAKGQSYRLDKEEVTVGDMIYSVEKLYNFDEGTVKETRYSINVANSDAEPTDKTVTTYQIE